MRTPTFARLALAAVLSVLALAAAPTGAHAAFTFTLTQVGGNVVVNGGGTLNTTALNPDGTGNYYAFISPSAAGLYGGPTNPTALAFYAGLTGPASFGSGGMKSASSGSGDLVGFYASSTDLIVPSGYVSGTALTDNDIYTGQSAASLGITPGTYKYTWGTGTSADSLTINAFVPEPGTWALLGAGAVALALATLRRRSHTADAR